MRQPYAFRADNGKLFQVSVIKTNKRTIVVQLWDGADKVKKIKLPKRSPKLLYREVQKSGPEDAQLQLHETKETAISGLHTRNTNNTTRSPANENRPT